MSPNVNFAMELVRLHDELGFPMEMSLVMASEKNMSVPLLGILLESSRRKIGKAVVREFTSQWRRLFVPTKSEKLALECILGKQHGN